MSITAILRAIGCVVFLLGPALLPAADDRIAVACVGDSVTFGMGLADPATQSYPKLLGDTLGAKYQTFNFGQSGMTLLRNSGAAWNAFDDVAKVKPRFVVISLGANDTKPVAWKHKDEFAKDLGDLADRFAALPSRPLVFLCLPTPCIGDQPEMKDYAIRGSVLENEVVPLVRQVAKARNLPLIDLFTPFKDKPQLLGDGIHPSAQGAALIASIVAEAITAIGRAATK